MGASAGEIGCGAAGFAGALPARRRSAVVSAGRAACDGDRRARGAAGGALAGFGAARFRSSFGGGTEAVAAEAGRRGAPEAGDAALAGRRGALEAGDTASFFTRPADTGAGGAPGFFALPV